MDSFLNHQDFILTEGSIMEQIRRTYPGLLHPLLSNAPLIYSDRGRALLAGLYQSYWQLALDHHVPFAMMSPTWRCNAERVQQAGLPHTINQDAVDFMKSIIPADQEGKIWIGGLLGCKNDCYQPLQGLTSSEAMNFHRWQVEALAESEPDFMIVETIPCVQEALGMALLLQDTGIPYIISFVIHRNGMIMDGHSLQEAMATIDSQTHISPLGYGVSCAYPTFLCPEQQPDQVLQRLICFQGNGSSLDHNQLDQSPVLQSNPVADWAQHMSRLHLDYGIRMLGGCCGTQEAHLESLLKGLSAAPMP